MAGRYWWAAAVLATALSGTGCAQDTLALGRDVPPAPREFRAAWVATVDNIDWPSQPGLSVDRQRAELDAVFDAAVRVRLNALVLQVRPACDALYRSDLEPWSEWLTGAQGKAPPPGWDPLEHAVAEAQKRGLELHAWFNPFRAKHRAASSPIAPSHRAREWMVEYNGELWLDPGIAEARAHSLRVILDVVERYDIDGVHMDDYFYPYPANGKEFPDEASYADYRRGGGRQAKGDWRRTNVDAFVKTLHQEIKERKRWVKFGISPFGIARPGVPAGIQAGIDQYEDLAADVCKWARERWCDYLSPQLYWPIRQKAQSYRTLLGYWAREVPRDVHLWVGNYTSKAVTDSKGWSIGELLEQIELTRAEPRATGNVHFSLKGIRDDTRRVGTRLREGPYQLPALVPASTWLDDEAPTAPGLRIDIVDGDLEVRWTPDDDARWRAVYLLCGDRWLLIEAVGRKPGIVITKAQLDRLAVRAVAVSSVDRCGNESERVVRSLR